MLINPYVEDELPVNRTDLLNSKLTGGLGDSTRGGGIFPTCT